jgi:hypothetical protein
MTIDILIGVFAILLIFASATERLVEIVKPLFLKITNLDWQVSIKVAFAVLVGFGLAALFQYDVLAKVGIVALPVLGYLAAGLIASVGSSVLHPILDWLKTLTPLPSSSVSTTTTTTVTPPATPEETVALTQPVTPVLPVAQ